MHTEPNTEHADAEETAYTGFLGWVAGPLVMGLFWRRRSVWMQLPSVRV